MHKFLGFAKYLFLGCLILFTTGCDLSDNITLIKKSEDFVNTNRGYLTDIVMVLDNPEIQKHTYIEISRSSGNSKWTFMYDSLHYKNDTVPIEPNIIKSWNMKKLLVGVEFDIVANRAVFEPAGINNKNDRFAVIHFYREPIAMTKAASCRSMIEGDTNVFLALDSFRCALDTHCVLISRLDYPELKQEYDTTFWKTIIKSLYH